MKAAELNAMHEKAKHCKHALYEVDDNGKVQCQNCGLTGYLRWEFLLPENMEFVDTDMGAMLRYKKEGNV